MCGGAGVVTLGAAGLSVASATVVARSIDLYLEASAGVGCTLDAALDDLHVAGIIGGG